MKDEGFCAVCFWSTARIWLETSKKEGGRKRRRKKNVLPRNALVPALRYVRNTSSTQECPFCFSLSPRPNVCFERVISPAAQESNAVCSATLSPPRGDSCAVTPRVSARCNGGGREGEGEGQARSAAPHPAKLRRLRDACFGPFITWWSVSHGGERFRLRGWPMGNMMGVASEEPSSNGRGGRCISCGSRSINLSLSTG